MMSKLGSHKKTIRLLGLSNACIFLLGALCISSPLAAYVGAEHLSRPLYGAALAALLFVFGFHWFVARRLDMDISRRQLIEEALQSSNAFSTNVINSMHDALAVIDSADFRIVSANKVFLKENGCKSEKEVLGRTCYEVTHDLDFPCYQYGHDCPLVESVRTGVPVMAEHVHCGRSGDRFEEIIASPIMNESGKVSQVIHISRDVTEQKQAESRIRELAYFDGLTGLPNRRLLLDRLNQAMKMARRSGRKAAVLFVDLDRFKNINDSLGLGAGDDLLIEVARRLEGCTREADTVARLSGDEFAVVLEGIEHDDSPAIYAQRILDAFSEPIVLGDHQIYSTCSIGISLFPRDGEDEECLLKNADTAMFAAKKQGRNRYHFFSEEMNAMSLQRLNLENGIRRALKGDEFFLCYQPQVSLENGEITCLEALIRWQDPEAGMISPADFIPLAEETTLILAIDEWVLRTACTQGRLWQENGYPGLKVAVNISGRQFKQPNFIDMIDRVLTETGFDPGSLELELTEGHLMDNISKTIMTLTDLKVRGIRLAIDDFGTGYSSLSYLKNFPIDRVKIDQSFVRSLPANESDKAIIQAIIALARSLDMEVIAEGVETREQVAFLLETGCLEMQGYYFSRPRRIDEMATLIDQDFPFEEQSLLGRKEMKRTSVCFEAGCRHHSTNI